jgi:hypothetical protein
MTDPDTLDLEAFPQWILRRGCGSGGLDKSSSTGLRDFSSCGHTAIFHRSILENQTFQDSSYLLSYSCPTGSVPSLWVSASTRSYFISL